MPSRRRQPLGGVQPTSGSGHDLDPVQAKSTDNSSDRDWSVKLIGRPSGSRQEAEHLADEERPFPFGLRLGHPHVASVTHDETDSAVSANRMGREMVMNCRLECSDMPRRPEQLPKMKKASDSATRLMRKLIAQLGGTASIGSGRLRRERPSSTVPG